MLEAKRGAGRVLARVHRVNEALLTCSRFLARQRKKLHKPSCRVLHSPGSVICGWIAMECGEGDRRLHDRGAELDSPGYASDVGASVEETQHMLVTRCCESHLSQVLL